MGDNENQSNPAPPEDPMTVDIVEPLHLEDDPPPPNSPPVWDPTRLRRAATVIATVQSQTVPQEAPIPSPLATLGRRQTEVAAMVRGMADGVRDLWHLCANTRRTSGNDNIRDEIARGRTGKKQSLGDANVGFVAWIERASAFKSDDLLVSDDESVDDNSSPATDTLRYYWIGRRTRIRLEPSGANSDRTLSEQLSNALNIFFSERKDGESGHFIIPPSQSALTINGIRVPTGAKAAGPLPPFAVIEIGDAAAFWWRDPRGLDYLPQRPTTNSRKRSRRLSPEEEFENFNDDEVSFAKKPKMLENASRLGTVRRSARIASAKAGKPAAWTASSRVGPPKIRHMNDLPQRAPRSPEVNPLPGPLPGPLPRNPPMNPGTGETPGPRPPRTAKPPAETRGVSPPTSPGTWNGQLRDRLGFWRDEAQRAGDSGNPRQILGYNNLDDNDVISAIASVWRPLIDWGTSYAFGTAYLFQFARLDDNAGGTCLHSPNPLVMPLIFNDNLPQIPSETHEYHMLAPTRKSVKDLEAAKLIEANRQHVAKVNTTPKNPNAQKEAPKPKPKTTEERREAKQRRKEHARNSRVGHFVLAVAETNPSGSDQVRLRFWDSSPNSVGKNVIRAHARQVVRNSGWMPQNVWPTFGEEDWALSPKQLENSCGLHVVFSAWAYMLRIPLNQGKDFVMRPRFYHPALEIVNLALRGMMDANTIRAFLHVYHYAAPRPLKEVQQEEMSTMPNERRQMTHLVQTALMNEDVLNRTIDRLQNLEASQSEAQEKEEALDPEPQGHKPPERPTPPGPSDKPLPSGGSKLSKGPQTPKDRSPSKHPSPPTTPAPQERTSPAAGSSVPKERKSPLPKEPWPTKEKPSGKFPNPEASPTPRSRPYWQELLRAGLQRHRAVARKEDEQKQAMENLKEAEEVKEAKKKFKESGRAVEEWEQEVKKRKTLKEVAETRENAHFLEERSSGALNDDQVCCAIASIWHGLRFWSDDNQPEFAFGTPTTFQMNRDFASGMEVVGSPYPLIIPMLFNSGKYTEQVGKSSTEDVGNIGHFVLGIAERTGNDVRLIFMDSSPNTVSRGTIRATAQSLVRNTGWMGHNERGLALSAAPDFGDPIYQYVPAQRLRNNCGFHVIINAWAYMLRIPIYMRRERTRDATALRGSIKYDEEFYRMGKRITNLAMRGLMDSTTIQAFLNLYGYADRQDPNNQEAGVRIITAQTMNPAILQNLVQELRDEEATAIALAQSIGQT